jgi:hypothetical protein
VTFLLAKAFGKPLVRLPAVVLGRFQHRFLVPRPQARPAGAGRLPPATHPPPVHDGRAFDDVTRGLEAT